MNEKAISYAIGTTVLVKKAEKEGVVHAVDIISGELNYAVDGSAWFSTSDLEFVSAPTVESIAAAIAIEAGEEGEDSDDDFDDEDEEE